MNKQEAFEFIKWFKATMNSDYCGFNDPENPMYEVKKTFILANQILRGEDAVNKGE